MKIQKKKFGDGRGGGGGVGPGGGGGFGLGGQGGCVWRSKAFVKIQKKKIFFLWGGGRGGRVGGRVQGGWERVGCRVGGGGGVGGVGGGGGQGGCERRSKVFVKIKKKKI